MGNLITALDIVEVGGVRIVVENADFKERASFDEPNAQTPEQHRDIALPGALYSVGSFTTRVSGSGAAGTAPFDGPLIKAAGMTETINAGTSVVYTRDPTMAGTKVDIDYWRGNALLVALANCVVRPEWVIEPNKAMRCNWQVHGTYTEPSSGSSTGVLTTAAARAPVCKGLAITIGGITIKLKRLVITIPNQWEEPDEDACGSHGIINPSIYERAFHVDATIRAQLPATSNWWNNLTGKTKMALSAVLGSDAGNILTVTADLYFREQIDPSQAAGRHEITLPLAVSYAAGDTGLTLTYT